MSGRAWTEQEDRVLTWWWAEESIHCLAERLQRTESAVKARAVKLGLRVHRETLSLSAFAKKSGYHENTIMQAVNAAGMRLQKIVRTNPRPQKPRTYAFTEKQQKEIIALIESRIIHHKARWKSTPYKRHKPKTEGLWGVDGWPEVCEVCGKNDRPRVGRKCRYCHQRQYAKARAERRRAKRAVERAQRLDVTIHDARL